MDALKILLDGANRNRTLFVLLSAFALFPIYTCLLYTSPSPRDREKSRMPSSA